MSSAGGLGLCQSSISVFMRSKIGRRSCHLGEPMPERALSMSVMTRDLAPGKQLRMICCRSSSSLPKPEALLSRARKSNRKFNSDNSQRILCASKGGGVGGYGRPELPKNESTSIPNSSIQPENMRRKDLQDATIFLLLDGPSRSPSKRSRHSWVESGVVSSIFENTRKMHTGRATSQIAKYRARRDSLLVPMNIPGSGKKYFPSLLGV